MQEPAYNETERSAFRDRVQRAGLTNVPDVDLELMWVYWQGASAQIASLREAIALTDEPATVFSALPDRLKQ